MRIGPSPRHRRVVPLAVVALTVLAVGGYALSRAGVLPDYSPRVDEPPPASFSATVREVPTGDALVLDDGRRVRLIGVDAPFPERRGFERARKALEGRALGRTLSFRVCAARPTDREGRILAHVADGGEDLGRALLGEGLAELYPDPRCLGDERAAFWRAAREAFEADRGLWEKVATKRIPADEAAAHMNRFRIVAGKVDEARVMRKLTVLYAEAGFRFVVFDDARPRFDELLSQGDPAGLAITAFGKITDYNGPQMILQDPAQIVRVGREGG